MNKYTKSELLSMSFEHPIIVFDGVCNLCDRFVQWVIKRDNNRIFRYATLQSSAGSLLLSSSDTKRESVLLAHRGHIYTYSDVALEVFRLLGGGWRILSSFRIIPKSIRDTIYHFVAKNRYKWFGKKSDCMVPDREIKSLFL